MPLGKTGLAAQWGMIDEVAFGARLVPTRFLEIRDEGMEASIERIESQGLRAGKKVTRFWLPNLKGAAGAVNFEVMNQGLGLLLKHIQGTVATSTPASGVNTRDHLFTVGGLDGKSMSQQKNVPGQSFTDNAFDYVGGKVSEWTLTNEVDGILMLSVTFDFMDEVGADVSTRLANTTSASAVLTLPGGTQGIYNGMPVTGAGIPGATTIIAVPTATTATLSANATATASGITATFAPPALATASYATNLVPLTYLGGTLLIGGVQTDVTNISLSGNNGLKADRYYIRANPRKKEQIEDTAPRALSGSFTADFNDRTIYNNFVQGAEAILVANWDGPIIETVSAGSITYRFGLQATMRRVRFDGETPKVGGPDVVMQPMAFTVLQPLDDSSAVDLRYRTTDVAP